MDFLLVYILLFALWKKNLYQLAEFVFPGEVLNYFSIVNIEVCHNVRRYYLKEHTEYEFYKTVIGNGIREFMLELGYSF